MSLSDAVLPEFDHEMANTRKSLSRVPAAKLTWKPHPKSNDFGWLASHIADLPSWTKYLLELDRLDISPVGEEHKAPTPPKSPEEILAKFEKNIVEARTAIAAASDEHWRQPWTLLAAGNEIFTMPRIGVLRGMILSHLIHHRAQLGVYLRLNDIPVPALYGPSADES